MATGSSPLDLALRTGLLPVTKIKGIGDKRAIDLLRLNIETIKDLLYHFPRLYLDRRNLIPINQIRHNENMLIEGRIIEIKQTGRYPKTRLSVTITDGTGYLYIIWFHQPYMKEQFQIGQKLLAFGKVTPYKNGLQMVAPEIEDISEANDTDDIGNFKRIVPVYPLTEGITQKFLRKVISNAIHDFLPHFEEILPQDIIEKYNFEPISKAISIMHFPENPEEPQITRKRFIYEEFFLLELAIADRRKLMQDFDIKGLNKSGDLIKRFIDSLPYSLTNGQRLALKEIYYDLESPSRMMRLLTGDVGCGKTLVAYISLLKATQNDMSGLYMIPTEVLSEQQYEQIKRWSDALLIPTYLYTGKISQQARRDVEENVNSGQVCIVVGTVALLNPSLNPPSIGLSIIDEQHRFGVLQRAGLVNKGSRNLLIMTATPIPRSLALTLYGDLSLTLIRDAPLNRAGIDTFLISNDDLLDIYNEIIKETGLGYKVYIIYPTVQDDDGEEIKAAISAYNHLKKTHFHNLKIALLHGQMQSEEKRSVREGFTSGDIQVLVATSIVEVGLDVTDASIMVIMYPERFGLSQLHQLRGRIGRGERRGRCYLVLSKDPGKEAKQRLSTLIKSRNGFELAEEDLKQRGIGDWLGARQHGRSLFKIASLQDDIQLLELARSDAFRIIAEGLARGFNPLSYALSLVTKRIMEGFEFIEGG